ncbi:type III-B CRISPR module RAMP protein Cmr6 [Paenibacillus chitinolyticus]|uniref:type III-B CRISPR module RAMP protein Cmr6 n=1 Tax=Paenibacillus chitinolyticus TaxID=79263 RepID=UPI00366BEF07
MIHPLLQSLKKRQELIVSQLAGYLKFSYRTTDKLLLGMGSSTPYTTISPLTLHWTYGIPYVPGSSLKGVIRNGWIHEEFEGREEKANQDEFFRQCFGTGADDDSASCGKLIFLDAYPVDSFEIVEDVQTPHYKTYYDQKGKTSPLDQISPTILPLIAVTRTRFGIYIGVNGSPDEFTKDQLHMIQERVICALSEYGVGAKTAIGYGLGQVTPLDK